MNFISYLKYCYKNFKFLFWMILFMLTGSLIPPLITTYSIWPFFSYTMYSYPERPIKIVKNIELVINGKVFNFYTHLATGYASNIERNCKYYLFLKTHNFKDPFYFKLKEKKNIELPYPINKIFTHRTIAENEFSVWLKNYIETIYEVKIKQLQINEIQINYDKTAKICDRNTKLIANF